LLVLTDITHFLYTEWRQEYISSLPPPADRLKAEVERYMSEYDQKVEEVRRLCSTRGYYCWCCFWATI